MKRKKEMTKFPLENKDNTDNQTDKVKTELIRKKYLYRRLIQTKPVNIPLKAAVDLIGPDCAYHLYTGSNINKRKKKTTSQQYFKNKGFVRLGELRK